MWSALYIYLRNDEKITREEYDALSISYGNAPSAIKVGAVIDRAIGKGFKQFIQLDG